MEFLSTYGWAFLVILVVIGAFVYFGGFNPSRSLPDKCLFGSLFICTDFQIDSSYAVGGAHGAISFTMKQNSGQTIFIQNANVTSQDLGNNLPCTINGVPFTMEYQMENLDVVAITCPLAGLGAPNPDISTFKGNKVTAKLRVDYRELRSTYTHVELGDLYGTVQ